MSDSSRDAGFPLGERAAVRARLRAERAEARGQIAALVREFDGIVAANALVAVDDEHDPEGASTAFERAHVAALLARERAHLAEVDRALERLERGEYGRCATCGELIAPERLEVRPATDTCVRCATESARRRRR
ncbi:TraR/DksA family transcriptional regulator [Streptomyces sp. 8L]|uniref:TraR/DksA family transcriptional regulator n=1 Tax=Streptomyces sp. 8L TaxID=2877242 RepID=UPI001CD6B7E6|nr:TraR/DksA C4-type zinc finger protein [Streptomyces sp. 8L]MCA1218581.1 TraR/DksA C4-type zinc finger protein [Streptomyces sp. 8L]